MTATCAKCGATIQAPARTDERSIIAAARSHWYASPRTDCIGAAVIVEATKREVYTAAPSSQDGRGRIDRLRRRAALLYRRIEEKKATDYDPARDLAELSAIEWSITLLSR